MRLASVATLVTLCLATTSVRASDDAPDAPAPASRQQLTKLPYDWTVDGIVTGALAVSTVTLLLLNNQLAPLQCNWCVPGTIDGNLSKSAEWSNPKAADTRSTHM